MWENFGGGKFWQMNGSKVFGKKFGKSVDSLLKTLAFINIGGENFSKLLTICQIRQNFPLQNFPTHGICLYGSLEKTQLLKTSSYKDLS